MGVSGAKGRPLNGRALCAVRRPSSIPNYAGPQQAHDTLARRSAVVRRRGARDTPGLVLVVLRLEARRTPGGASSMDTPTIAPAGGIEREARRTRAAPGKPVAAPPRFLGDTPSRIRSCSPNRGPSPKADPRLRRPPRPRVARRRRPPKGSRRNRASWVERPMRHRPKHEDPTCRWDSWCLATCTRTRTVEPARCRRR